jgi:Zn-dependent protease
MFRRGYWKVADVRGVPVRLHWTLPVGMLLLGGLSPVLWLALLVIVLLHEAGHALFVRRYGFTVLSLDVTGFGGMCRWAGFASERQRSVIAWGGVAAQALLLAAALLFVAVAGWPSSALGAALASAFVSTNALLIVLNLLPMRPFDGAEAWKLVRDLWSRRFGHGGSSRLGHR